MRVFNGFPLGRIGRTRRGGLQVSDEKMEGKVLGSPSRGSPLWEVVSGRKESCRSGKKSRGRWSVIESETVTPTQGSRRPETPRRTEGGGERAHKLADGPIEKASGQQTHEKEGRIGGGRVLEDQGSPN